MTEDINDENTAYEHSGLAGTCETCPFNDGLTESATQAQNWGCLPTGAEIVGLKERTGQNWGCHDDPAQICKGLCHNAKHNNLDLSTGNIVKYATWYHKGEAEAVREATEGVQP